MPGYHRIQAIIISIHAPRGGSDSSILSALSRILYFNPRSPWGERLAIPWVIAQVVQISIHAPRGGSDTPSFSAIRDCMEVFQSTLPVGGATQHFLYQSKLSRFQSTLPVGGATTYLYDVMNPLNISIHPPRGGSDMITLLLVFLVLNFNPRSPWGERRTMCCRGRWGWRFQSTLPVGGATLAFAFGRTER